MLGFAPSRPATTPASACSEHAHDRYVEDERRKGGSLEQMIEVGLVSVHRTEEGRRTAGKERRPHRHTTQAEGAGAAYALTTPTPNPHWPRYRFLEIPLEICEPVRM